MNGVFIIPTGIGCKIGGHAGDATPAAKLIASICDNLIVHPNVVNASDINEMSDNMVYVEGSILDRFLEGRIGLDKVHNNKILVAVNKPVGNEIVNAVSAARATIGLDAKIVELSIPLRMVGWIEGNRATGDVFGWKELVRQVKQYNFDALAITTKVEVDRDVKFNYFRNGGINPWGGVEARASKLIASTLNKPVAHSPTMDATIEEDKELYLFNEIVDPRIAAETVSMAFLHCILKGLHRAPQIGSNMVVSDIDFLMTPVDCVSRPHYACLERKIPVIAVKENKSCLDDIMPDEFIFVENYLEAAGIVSAMKAGIVPESVKRPLKHTSIFSCR